MQIRRQILLVALLILALLLLALLVMPWNKADRGSRKLSLPDTSQVDRIVLTDSYHSSELVKYDNLWFLYGTEPVNPVAVDNLLITAGRLEIASVVDRESFEKTDAPQGDTRLVTFFSGEKVLLNYSIKSFPGRFLLIPPDSESAFYVSVPGYPGLDLDRVYSASPDHYRDHLLMDLRPSEISSIEMKLASGEAFRFEQDSEGSIRCEAVSNPGEVLQGEPNGLAMQLLFSYFTSVRYEERSGIEADSLRGSEYGDQKMAHIRIETFAGESHSLEIFSYHETSGSEPHLFRALVLHNDEQDAIFVNYIYLDVLMRGISHYFREK